MYWIFLFFFLAFYLEHVLSAGEIVFIIVFCYIIYDTDNIDSTLLFI